MWPWGLVIFENGRPVPGNTSGNTGNSTMGGIFGVVRDTINKFQLEQRTLQGAAIGGIGYLIYRLVK